MEIAEEIFKLDNLEYKIDNVISEICGFNLTVRYDNVEKMFKLKHNIVKLIEKEKKEGKL